MLPIDEIDDALSNYNLKSTYGCLRKERADTCSLRECPV